MFCPSVSNENPLVEWCNNVKAGFCWFVLEVRDVSLPRVALQVAQQDEFLSQLQVELRTERERVEEATRETTQCKKVVSNLQDEIEHLQRTQRDANNKVNVAVVEAGPVFSFTSQFCFAF